MTIELPLWMQANSYAARLDRAFIASQKDEGVEEGFKVAQRGAGPNMTADIPAGISFVLGDDQADQGVYRVRSTATENLTGFVAASSTQRIDLVCLRINDPNAGGPAGSNAALIRVAGTENASPVAPAVPTSAIALAQVGPFTTSTSSITNAMITDLRVRAGLKAHVGALQPHAAAGAPSGWLFCDGSAISRTTFARLFDVIGTVYGVGDGSTTFNLPDLRGRSPVGLANMGTAAGAATGDTRVQAAAGGAGGNVQLQIHQHGPGDLVAPIHQHGPGTLTASSTGFIGLQNGDVSHVHVDNTRPAVGPGGTTTEDSSVGVHSHPVTGVTDFTAAPLDITGVTDFSGTGGTGNVHPYAGVYVLIRT